MSQVFTVTGCLREISSRLTDAIARAAVTPDQVRGRLCAESGSEREAVRIPMDLDELLHEAETLHGAVTLLGRMSRDDSG